MHTSSCVSAVNMARPHKYAPFSKRLLTKEE